MSFTKDIKGSDSAVEEDKEALITSSDTAPDLEALPSAPKSKISAALEAARVVTYVSLYLFCGPALILINNKILRQYHFPYPMMLSSLGLLTTSVFCLLLVLTGCVELKHRDAVTRQFFVRNLLPVGASLAMTRRRSCRRSNPNAPAAASSSRARCAITPIHGRRRRGRTRDLL